MQVVDNSLWMNTLVNMIIEVWQDDSSITAFEPDNKFLKSLLEGDIKLLRTIEGEDWEDCMKKHHELMGWEEYKPF